jgi:membrane protease YdiL (CAAX protease family)
VPVTASLTVILLFALMVLWIYLFLKAYLQRKPLPWGFGIVILGILVSGYSFYISIHHTVLPVNLLFVLMLVGILWNINDIGQLVRIRKKSDFFCSAILGIFVGLLLGILLLIFGGGGFIQIDERFSWIGLVVLSIQVSTAEEFLFRGFLLGYLKKSGLNTATSNVLQAIVFTAMHLLRFSSNWVATFLIFLAAMVAGYFTLKDKSIIMAIFMHNAVNMIAIIWWFTTH